VRVLLSQREVLGVTIEEALGALARDRGRHMMTELASERDLDVLEEALGERLPEDFRALLVRFGGGIFYERHELFGARRLMIHDIELVPDLLSFRRLLAAEGGPAAEAGLVPFHRADGKVHLLDLRRATRAPVLSAEGERSYPDLACFLEQVVIPRPPAHRP
jgi:hypothetical protein